VTAEQVTVAYFSNEREEVSIGQTKTAAVDFLYIMATNSARGVDLPFVLVKADYG